MKTWISHIESIVHDILLSFFVIYRYVIWREIKVNLKKRESVMNMLHIEKQNIECYSSKNMEIRFKKYNFICFDFEDNLYDLFSRFFFTRSENRSGSLSKLFGSEHFTPAVFEKNNYFIFICTYCFSNRRYKFDVTKTFNISSFYCVSLYCLYTKRDR